MTAFRTCFLSALIAMLLPSALSATEYLNRNLDWKIYLSHCKGELRKIGGGYEVSKERSPDVNSDYESVYFFNENGVPCKPGLYYRVVMKLADCDATITPTMIVTFPAHAGREPGQYSVPFANGTAAVEFLAQENDTIRVNLILSRGDGKVVVRSVKIDQIADPAAQAKSKVTGNLLGQGSGFEAGPHGLNAFSAYSWWFGWIDPGIQPVFDDKVFHSGTYSLRLTAEDFSNVEMHENHNGVWFVPIKLDPAKAYTLSAWMKSDRPGFLVDIGCGERIGNGVRVEVTTEWKRYSFPFKPDRFLVENYCRAGIGVADSVHTGSLWIDDVQLEEGSSASEFKNTPLEFGAALEMEGDKLLRKSKLAESAFTLRFRNNTPSAVSREIHYVIRDYWDRDRASGTVAAAIPAHGNLKLPLPVPDLPCGYYRAYFEDKSKNLYDEAIFGIYEPMAYKGKLPKDWPLGCHDSVCLPILRDLGFGWVRPFHDFTMRLVAPEKDRFNFKNTDVVVEKCEEANLNLMPIFGPAMFGQDGLTRSIPEWAIGKRADSAIKGYGANPLAYPSMDAWRKYVRALVERYKGRIPAWEVFNEPDCWVTPDEYLIYLQAAYDEAKKADPSCWIVAGSTTSDFGKQPLPWTRSFMEKDKFTHFDAISVHMYSNLMPERTLGGTENFLGFLRSELRKNGRDIPVWHTEKSYSIGELGYSRAKFNLPPSYNGTPGFRVKSFRERAEYLIRESVIDSCVGKGPFFWYAEITSKAYIAQKVISGFDPFWLWHTEYDGSPYPELPAANGLARMLENRSTPRELVKLSDTIYCGLYDGPAGSLAVLWNIKGAAKLKLSAAADKFKLFDFFGEPLARNASRTIELNTAPVYLQGDGITANEMKRILLDSGISGSSVRLSGGLEKEGTGLVLAVYADNGGTGGKAIDLSVVSVPDGWVLGNRHWQGTSETCKTLRAVFPVRSFRPSAEKQSFTLDVKGGSRETISVPPFESESALEAITGEESRAVAERVAEPKKIDGLLADWKSEPFAGAFLARQVKLGRDAWKDAADLSCEARFAYDEKNLYAAFTVHDNVVERFVDPGQAYMSDSVEFFLGLDPNAPEHDSIDIAAFGPGDFQIFLAPGTPNGPYQKATASIARSTGNRIDIASSLTPDGYVLELAIPWASLKPGFVPRKGMELLMSFQATDTDTPKTVTNKKIFWMGDESNYTCPRNWGRLTLE